MHSPHFNAAQLEALNNTPLDFHFISSALLHSLGMGAILMAVTALVDHRQQKGETPQATVQNSSNILFMCVAIATVIILVGNNVARAFALGAAIALIRFKMKLGESSSGSGLLFAILCGMSSAVGLHAVGWTLAIGYSIIQATLSLVVAKMEPRLAPQTTAQTPAASVPTTVATSLESSETALSADSPGHPASPIRPHLIPTRLRDGKGKEGVTLMSFLAIFLLAGQAHAVECAGEYQGNKIRIESDHAYGASAIAFNGYSPIRAAECRFSEIPDLSSALKSEENYAITCTKYGRKTATAVRRWKKSLVGTRFRLDGTRGWSRDLQPAEILLIQSVAGNASLHAVLTMEGFEFGAIADLSPSPNGQWDVVFSATSAAGEAQSVECAIERD